MGSFPSLLPLLLLSLSLLSFQAPTTAFPLSTSSRWIVDESGHRVKLACVNWPSHLDTVLAEGLWKQPLDSISLKIASMGFNCVRLTWPLFLATNDSLANLTVWQSFQALRLNEPLAAVERNNKDLVKLPLIQAFKEVVTNLGNHNIMVIVDNHISKPGWCCSNTDGNGFFGDQYFNPDVWVKGLTKMATLFNGTTNVVGMSLRNELRGSRQNSNDWYRYMQRGAEAVHAANPNVLIILSGLIYDNDLSYLSSKQIDLTFKGKTVFELHWYAFTDGSAWKNGNPNQVCGSVAASVMRRAGFLLNQGWPLFLSEFGVEQRGTNVNDNRYLGCILGVAAELDLDWAVWTLQGNYYIREGNVGLDEVYGMLTPDWSNIRNSSVLQKYQAIQAPFRGPGLSNSQSHIIIFHPSTGLCVLNNASVPKLGPCNKSEAWTFTKQQTIALKNTSLCLHADGASKPAKLGSICSDTSSKWELISDSKMHVSSKNSSSSSNLCLDVGFDGKSIVTNPCKCISYDPSCDPESQWFKMVNSTRSYTHVH